MVDVRARRRKGQGTVAQRPNGRWIARFYVREDGQSKRRAVMGQTREEALERMLQAQAAAREADDGDIIEAIANRVANRVLKRLGFDRQEDATHA